MGIQKKGWRIGIFEKLTFQERGKLINNYPPYPSKSCHVIKVAEHSFQVPIPWRPFFTMVKVNHRSIYSHILAKGVCCCHGNAPG